MTATTTNNNNKIDYTTIVDGKEEENHWIRKSVLFVTLLVCLGFYSTTNNTTRFVNNVPVEATSSLVRGGAGGGAGDRDGVRGGRIQVTQWNPHYENTDKARGFVDNLVYGNDFVSLIMFEDRNWTPGGAYKKINNGDYCTFDDSPPHYASWAILVYDSSKWDDMHDEVHGCLVGNDRPYTVNNFKNKNDNTIVTVVAAHFPHGGDPWSKLGDDIKSHNQSGNVIFMGDTNLNRGRSSQYIFGGWGLTAVLSSDLLDSCCYDGAPHTYEAGSYDRVITTFGSGGSTTMGGELFAPNPGAYHKPIKFEFNYQPGGGSGGGDNPTPSSSCTSQGGDMYYHPNPQGKLACCPGLHENFEGGAYRCR